MSRVDVIRAWKDEEYRASLSEAERAQLPAHPAGLIELDDQEMKAVLGAGTATSCFRRCTCM
jgi:mersacidin/lichenicidin family type 2 lantibiotic